MKKILLYAMVMTLAIFTACNKDDDPKPAEDGIGITGNITENTTWTSGNVYILKTRVAVVDGVTLTIEPGVIVKGEAGTGANATALVITRGAKLMAQGTATSPIIFTSVADYIEPGDVVSPNLNPTLDGLWGGLIILGKARISVDGDATEASIEGIPADDLNGKYGGTNDADNSGIITYVSIRHGGSNIGEGNEINGLTLGGVGSGTTISHIEIVANQDDGIEWFGGTVNVSNAIVWNNGDDAIDTDQAWAGTLDNFVVVNPGDKAFELDGPEGTYAGVGHTITNGTVYMESCVGGYDDDSNTDAKVSNIFFTGVTEDTGTSNDYNVNGEFVATNLQFDVTGWDDDGTQVIPVALDYFADMDATIISEVTTATVGADMSEFTATWSWAVAAGAF